MFVLFVFYPVGERQWLRFPLVKYSSCMLVSSHVSYGLWLSKYVGFNACFGSSFGYGVLVHVNHFCYVCRLECTVSGSSPELVCLVRSIPTREYINYYFRICHNRFVLLALSQCFFQKTLFQVVWLCGYKQMVLFLVSVNFFAAQCTQPELVLGFGFINSFRVFICRLCQSFCCLLVRVYISGFLPRNFCSVESIPTWKQIIVFLLIQNFFIVFILLLALEAVFFFQKSLFRVVWLCGYQQLVLLPVCVSFFCSIVYIVRTDFRLWFWLWLLFKQLQSSSLSS